MTVAARVKDDFWDTGAGFLVNCVRPVIAWARCEKGLPIGDDPVPAMLSLQALTGIVQDRKLPVPVASRRIELVDLTAAPADLFAPLLGYLDNLPCYDPRRASGVEQPEQALTQHSYVLMRVPSVLSASSP
jgi:hypothetical protein